MKMDKMLKQAQKMQAQMAKMQEELAAEVVEGSAGGGMVTAKVTGISISPEVVDPQDVEMLEDLVLAAIGEAMRKSRELSEQRMAQITGGMSLPGLF
jgi:DNA-binding YbaB/EbfC family protein